MIRAATAEDEKLVHALVDEFETELPNASWRDPEPELRYDAAYLAEEVGIATLKKRGARVWLLDLLYVRPSARGHGVGTELLRAAAEHARSEGAEMLELELVESNTAARRLYERLGFSTVERVLAAPVERLLNVETGPTFGCVHVQTDDAERVRRDAAKVLHREPEVEQAGDWVRVRSDATDADPAQLKSLARELSYMSAEVTLALGVEQGAVVRYVLYDRGSMVDEYLSVPEFHGPLPPGDVVALGANPTVVARLTNADAARVRAVARTASSPAELPPALELYAQIADVVGVSV